MTMKSGQGVTIVTCDYTAEVRFAGEPKDCPEEFRSFSAPKVIKDQLANARWGERTKDRIKQHFCPGHADKLGLGEAAGIHMPSKRNY